MPDPRAMPALMPRWALGALAWLVTLASCTPTTGVPVIRDGEPCAACGMAIHDRHFACARGERGHARAYDAIECLLRDSTASGRAWLSDYDQRSLHPAESLWVVQGRLVSPMGGGFAAFRDRAGADAVAREQEGRVDRLDAFSHGGHR